MHQSNIASSARALTLCRNRFSPSAAASVLIFIQITLLFTVCVVYIPPAIRVGQVNKLTIKSLPISESDISKIVVFVCELPTPFIINFRYTRGIKSLIMEKNCWYIERRRICCHLFLSVRRASWILFRNNSERVTDFFFDFIL